MWEHTVKLPGRWLERKEALAHLGISEARFDALVKAGWIVSRGRGSGKRFGAETVLAVGILWARLDELLGEELTGDPE